MKSRLLLLALEDLFKKELAGYLFPSPDGGEKPVEVFLHSWPQEQLAECFPSIVLRWGGSEMTEEQADAYIVETVAIALGVYSPGDQRQAGILLAELNDAVMQILHKYNNRIVAGLFEREYPIESQQPSPELKWSDYHAATIVTKWNYRIPITPLEHSEKIVEAFNP